MTPTGYTDWTVTTPPRGVWISVRYDPIGNPPDVLLFTSPQCCTLFDSFGFALQPPFWRLATSQEATTEHDQWVSQGIQVSVIGVPQPA